jgi:hypothetical protein
MHRDEAATLTAAKPDCRRAWTLFPKVLVILVGVAAVPSIGTAIFFTASAVVNQSLDSGSARGERAIEWAEKAIGSKIFPKDYTTITNARAEWTAFDSDGERSIYANFDIPPRDVPYLEGSILRAWKGRPLHSPQSMPAHQDAPDWFRESLADPIIYQVDRVTVGMSRVTGRVLIVSRAG